MLNRLRGLRSSWMEDRDHTKETELISVGSLIFQAVSLDEKKQIQNKKESPRANKCRIRKKLQSDFIPCPCPVVLVLTFSTSQVLMQTVLL